MAQQDIVNTVVTTICKYRMIESGDTVVAAVSGGPDSLALLSILAQIRHELGFHLVVAHVNHSIRIPAADEDQRYVEGMSRQLGLTCHSMKIDVPGYLASYGGSIEEIARLLRYRCLQQIRHKVSAKAIAVGHHSGDQAETVLLQMVRGAGTRGLAAMEPVTGRGIIRPLLYVERADIEQYCRESGIVPRLDATNTDTVYVRNKIRLQLLPLLEREYNPAIRRTLVRTAEIMREDERYLEQQAGGLFQQACIERSPTQLTLDIREFIEAHPALLRRCIRQAFLQISHTLKGITYNHVENILSLARGGNPSGQLILPGPLTVYRRYRHLIFTTDDIPVTSVPLKREVVLSVPGVNVLPELDCRIVTGLCSVEEVRTRSTIHCCRLDYDQLTLPLVIRTRRPGDRFVPCGMKHGKKLKEWMIDEKIPRADRDGVLLLCDQHHILCVLGYRAGEYGKVTRATRTMITVTIESMKGDHNE